MTSRVWVFAPAAVALSSFGALIVSLIIGGAADPLAIADPGPVVRWGLPTARLFHDFSFATTVGALSLAMFAAKVGGKTWRKLLDIAAAAAMTWTVSALATALFIFMNATGVHPNDEKFGPALFEFITNVTAGQLWSVIVLGAALVSVLSLSVSRPTGTFWTFFFSVAAIYPLAEMGHAAGAASHDLAVSGMLLHLLGVSVWVGGLIALVLVRPLKYGQLTDLLTRFSQLAFLAAFVTGFSGIASAMLRVGTVEALLTPYGYLIIGKTLAFIVLAGYGIIQRNFIIKKIEAADKPKTVRNWFWLIVVTEIMVMGAANGIAAALSQTRTPVPQELPTLDSSPARILTGETLPPEPDLINFFVLWRFDLLWMVVSILAILWYIWGVIRLKKRGDAWPWYRTVLFVSGMLLFFYSTNGALNAYEKYLFSVHMIAHMSLGMLIPVLIVPAAPVTLLLRAVKKRPDGSMGMREWVLWMVQSKWLRIVGHPIVAAAIFALSLWIFYYTPMFMWATSNHLGHVWMVIHFSIAGFLFVQSLVGIDPVHYRPPYTLRLVLLLGTMAFHAFFGLSIMMNENLMSVDWYGAMGWDYGVSALEDQQTAGGIAWGIGEIPTMLLGIIVAVGWSKSEEKVAKRTDARARRTGDQEREDYNAYLKRLAEHDQHSQS